MKKKKGPIAFVEKGNLKIPIYFTPIDGKENYSFTYNVPGEGRKFGRVTGTLDQAKERAAEKLKLLNDGIAHVADFSRSEAEAFKECLSVVAKLGVTITGAIREYYEAKKILGGESLILAATAFSEKRSKTVLIPKTFPEVAEEFLASLEKRGMSMHYTRTMKGRLAFAKKSFCLPITAIDKALIETWLDAFKGRNRKNYRDAMVTVFNWAKKQRYLPRNEETEAELTEIQNYTRSEITFLKPENFKYLANYIFKNHQDFAPYIFLGGLAGMRTSEICRLDWKEVSLDKRQITVNASITKMKARRIIPMSEALAEWVTMFKEKEGPVLGFHDEKGKFVGFKHDQSFLTQWDKVKRTIKDKAGNLLPLPPNVLRHSYATYRIAIVEDAQKVSLEMGNSPQILFTNYRGLSDKKQAEQFFATMPGKV